MKIRGHAQSAGSIFVAAISTVAFLAIILIGRSGGPTLGERLESVVAHSHPDGKEIAIPEATGAPSLIHYWATWCPPCMDEMPVVVELGRTARELGVKTYALSVRDDAEKVAATELAKADAYRLANDPSGRATMVHGIAGIPETLLLDREGRLVLRVQGPLDERRQAQILSVLRTL